MKENHAHYFGSLPKEFMWRRIIDRHAPLGEYQELWDQFFPDVKYGTVTFTQFSQSLSEVFGTDSKENIQNFFLLYELLHYLLKSKNPMENTDLYQQGASAIAHEFFSQGIENFVLLVGISDNPDETLFKLERIERGFERAEKQYSKKVHVSVRLSIARNKDGTVKNTSPSSLLNLLELLDKNPYTRLNGFDFSGEENPKQFGQTLELLYLLLEYNEYLSNNQRPCYVISIHAGENCFDYPAEDQLNAFEQLLSLNWTNLGHGTFLWIPVHLISISEFEDRARHDLLLQYGKAGKTFEICPTANILLTPLVDPRDIPLHFFKEHGIIYTINTDNPTLFSTTLLDERRKVSRTMQ